MAKHALKEIYVTPTVYQAYQRLVPGPTVSLAASFNTLSTDIRYDDHASYQINITTTNSTGTFFLQCSDDNVNFVDIGTAAVAAAANDTAVVWVNFNFVSPFIRLRYAAGTAGTGTCTILLTAKSTGA